MNECNINDYVWVNKKDGYMGSLKALITETALTNQDVLLQGIYAT